MEANSRKLIGLEKKKKIEEEWNFIYSSKHKLSRADFPSHFVFGVATSAYQVEGGSKEGGKGPSIWDSFSHSQGKICDGSNGDVAVDHYHRYKEDIELISKLGFKAYRFSISWSRIFPDGLGTKINHEGIKYYNDIIDALLERDIEPFITLYHWDLPLNLEESYGGWLDEQTVKYFAIYAETCFGSFGNKVKRWITINEPLQTVVNGYCTGIHAPGRSESSSTEPFLVAHNQLLAHAEAVSIYRNKFKDEQGGEIGLVVDCEWPEPLSDNLEDKAAATRRLDFQLGWYLDPIFFGDYPESMRERLGDRLPTFSQRDRELLKHSLDFIGLNHYTSRFVGHAANSLEENDFYKIQDVEIIAEWEGGEVIGEKAASSWLYVVPWGIRKVLNYIAERYDNPPVYITENGMDDEDDDISPLHEMLDDKARVSYFKAYLAAIHQAILHYEVVNIGDGFYHKLCTTTKEIEALAPEPYPGQVEECLQNISDDCGVIIFNKILDNGKYSDVEECCTQLLTLGIKCHNTIMESTLASPEMKGVNKTEIWKNSDKLWKECTSISPSS